VKPWYYILLIAIAVLGCAYLYLHRQELGLAGLQSPKVDTTPPTDASDSTASGDQGDSAPRPARMVWQRINRTPDGFTVDMPSEIKEIQIPAYTERGGAEQVSMIFCNPDFETTFSVAWADNPPVARANGGSPDRTLEMARDDALARTQTTLLGDSRSNPQGFPARDFTARNIGGGIFNSRMVFAGSRLYMLTAAFPSVSARRDSDVTRFFNSFRVASAANAQ
jgi:hypothetical protein